MKLEKAIEILDDWRGSLPQFTPRERRDAARLGIEALEVIQVIRRLPGMRGSYKLPGETEE